LDVAIEDVVLICGGSQPVFGLLFDVADCVVAGGIFLSLGVGGFGVPADVVGLGVGEVDATKLVVCGNGGGDVT
jgi:hypothetical protein